MSLGLAQLLKARREQAGISPQALARTLGCSPSQLAKIEAAEVETPLDASVRALLAIGVSPAEIAAEIAAKPATESLRRAS